MATRRVILVVRDGWGYSEETSGNAVYIADTPNNDHYLMRYPWTTLKCYGKSVGLPDKTQGGSEAGHVTMGSGRIVLQPLEVINRFIADNSFYNKLEFKKAINHIKKTHGSLHLAGLFSDQGSHGTIHHLFALLELARRNDLENVYIHCFLDGRDVPERSAIGFLEDTRRVIEEKKIGKFASIIGRFYAMDRDNNWERTKKAYDLLTQGVKKRALTPIEALETQYIEKPDLTDYYVEPVSLVDCNDELIATVKDGDAFVLWNFRSDRARQITYALTQQEFNKFKRAVIINMYYVCMSTYDQDLILPVVFSQDRVINNLGTTISRLGLKQLRIAETEKYAHVTFFFNSQNEKPYKGERRILIPSSKVPNYKDQPEMRANEITNRLIPEINRRFYDFILVNYANGDLVGHSANLKAGVEAAEVVDKNLGRVVDAGLEMGYIIVVTGDHGNLETMLFPDGSRNPSHGFNAVPFIIIADEMWLRHKHLRNGAGLSSISPTILDIMSIKKPREMTSQSLFA